MNAIRVLKEERNRTINLKFTLEAKKAVFPFSLKSGIIESSNVLGMAGGCEIWEVGYFKSTFFFFSINPLYRLASLAVLAVKEVSLVPVGYGPSHTSRLWR